MRLLTTRQFERGLRRAIRRRKDPDKLWAIVGKLLEDQPLEPYNRLHRLIGNWSGYWECHVEPDWLLVWRQFDDVIFLERTGTHSDIFG